MVYSIDKKIVDIGRPVGAHYSNQGETNQYAPPPYSGSSSTVCSKCGATRSDASARFCPSCGQPFNKY